MATNPNSFDIPEPMRRMADRSVDQARKAFDEFVDATQKAVTMADDSGRSAQAGMADAGRQALAFMEENINASFDLAQRLVRARDLEEVASIQQDFMRRQMEAMASQGHAVGATFTRAATDAAGKTGGG